MTTKQEIQKLVAGLKYDVGFEDVSNEPSYVVDEIMKIIDKKLEEQKKEILQSEIERKEEELSEIDFSGDDMFGYKAAIEHDIQHLENLIKEIK